MFADAVEAISRRLSPGSLLGWAVTLVVVYALTDSVLATAGAAAGVALVSALDVAEVAYGVDQRWTKAVFGAVVVGASAVWFVVSTGETGVARVLPVLGVAAGGWILFDARADFSDGRRATGGDEWDPDAGEAMLVMQHTSLVARTLRDGPKAVPEIATACDLTESRVRQALAIACEDDTVYRVAVDPPTYALDERKVGVSGFLGVAARGTRRLVSRLVRPFGR
jgi:hypothetical protein